MSCRTDLTYLVGGSILPGVKERTTSSSSSYVVVQRHQPSCFVCGSRIDDKERQFLQVQRRHRVERLQVFWIHFIHLPNLSMDLGAGGL